LQNGNAPVFGSIETLMSFSSVWYVCVVVGRRMMVWQGNCQVKCGRQKSHEAVVEGFATEKISCAGFCFAKKRGKLSNLVFFFFKSLSRGKVRDYPLRNVLREAKCLSKS